MVITRALIEASSHEGDAIYRTTRAIADPALRTRNGHYDETRDDPERSLVPRGSANEADYKEFFSLQERAFRRVGTAMRRWVALEQKALSVDKPDDRAFVRQVALERLIGRQLKALDVQEARLADYLQHPLEDHNEPERSPAILALDIFLLVLLDVPILYYVWRRRRRAQAAAAPSPSAA
jgi:hypothetical protein